MSAPRLLEITPRPPYSLAASSFGRAGGTRRHAGGRLDLTFRVDDRPCWARVAQRAGGELAVALHAPDPDAAAERLRFLLAVDLDIAPFVARFQDDPLLADALRQRRGMRPLPYGSVAHALLRAMCGQLVRWQEAARVEARIVRRLSPEIGALRLPPTRDELAAAAPAELASLGLVSRRAAALVRVARQLDIEGLAAHPTSAVVERLCREPQLGPWSAAVVATGGLGRVDAGLVGDLGLIRVAEALHGRSCTVEDTRDLLRPYGDWAGLASSYLLSSSAVAAAASTSYAS